MLMGGAFQQQYMNGVLWCAFVLVAMFIYWLFSDGDFSFLMTCASLTRGFAFAVLMANMMVKKHARGVSLKSLQLYTLVFFSRLCSVMQHDGYLPYDKSGDHVYHVAEFFALGFSTACVVLMSTQLKTTYQRDVDSFGALHVPSEFGIVYIVVPCLLFAVVVHPSLNRHHLSDTAWTFSMYLESLAIVPQLYMFQKQAKGIVEVLVTHTTFAVGIARVMDMVFWMSSYKELTGNWGSSVGVLVLLTQFVHIVIMGDFFYYYAVSVKTGQMMQLPSLHGVV